VSNPVAPPPPNQGGFPPPANQGFGAAPTAPGQPYPGQPYPGQEATQSGQPYSGQPFSGQQPTAPGQPFQPQQGFGDAPAPFAPTAVAKKRGAGTVFLRIGAVVLAAIVIFVVKDYFFGDKAKDAAVGDCVAASKQVQGTSETDAKAKVVDCSSADAAYTVVGRVDGESDVNSKSCETYFVKEDVKYYVYASSTDTGGDYLLCLQAK
jgi:hypothetical protein